MSAPAATSKDQISKSREVIALPGFVLPLVAMLAAAILAATGAWYVARTAASAEISSELDRSLTLAKRTIQSEIERFRYLPRVLGEDTRIFALAGNRQDSPAVDRANRYLETVAHQSGAAFLYVLDAQGMTLATSNWNTSESLIGNNYSFRPYFRNAMTQGEGRYYAIGVTTGKPGYFLAYRVGSNDGAIVVVVKVELRQLEATWRSAGAMMAVADGDGVVFLAGRKDWKYRPISRLTADVIARFRRERTYDGIDFTSVSPFLNPSEVLHPESYETLASSISDDQIVRFRHMPRDDWTIMAVGNISDANTRALFFSFGAALLAIVTGGAIFATHQRRQLIGLRLRQGETLEHEVAQRTQELADEIDIRRRAESELRDAQTSLIAAEKLAALGQLAASVTHELVQPVAAMKTYLASARREAMSQSEPPTDLVGRLDRLVNRMQHTLAQLRFFSKNGQDAESPFDLHHAIEGALITIGPGAREADVSLTAPDSGLPMMVTGDQARVEQVLVNLVRNAVDAVRERPAKEIKIKLDRRERWAMLSIQDNGEGIANEVQSTLFDPFVTTRASGEGMGLGLAISDKIVRDHNGIIRVEQPPEGGSIFVVELPLQHEDELEASKGL